MQKTLNVTNEEKGFDENSNELRLTELDLIGNELIDTSYQEFEVKSEITSDSCEVFSENQENSYKFFENAEVLARWSDGLFYLGIVLEVDDKEQKCFVKFEDGSEFWTLFQHLQRAQMNGSEILCALCENGNSEPPNEIVLCDHCGLGYHQQCHNPMIGEEVLQPEVMWNCRGCVFATTAKKGGATKVGPNAKAMQEMKKALPYDLASLNWDAHHKTNEEQCYCYCGGPGEWYIKMIQCCRCKQWFHEACIQCLEMPMLYGDRFYVFVCSVCNCGPEYIKRLDLDWVDVAHLVIFNLTILHNRKYHELESSVIPFVNGNWELLQIPKQYQKCLVSQRKKQLLLAFQRDQKRFKCGREVKKKMSLWSLRVRVPPPAPIIQVPLTGPISDFLVNGVKSLKKKSKHSSSSGRRCRSSDTSSAPTTPEKSIVSIRPKTSVPDSPIRNKFSRKKRKGLTLAQPSTSVNEVPSPPKRKRGRPSGSKNKKGKKAIIVTNKQKYNNFSIARKSVCRMIFNDSTDDDNSSRGTLESIIPPPNNFNGSNNPFSFCDLPQPKHNVSLFNGAAPTKRKLNCDDLCIKNGVVRLKRRCTRNKCRIGSDATRSNGTSEASLDVSPSEQDSHSSVKNSFVSEGVQTTDFTYDDLRSSVNSYFGASNRIANGENFSVLAKRVTADGKIQYLIQWDSSAVA